MTLQLVLNLLSQTSAPAGTGGGTLHVLPGVFALLVLAAGWYYIFYSPAAHRLGAVEAGETNRLRVVLRRANGVAMMLLAVAFYAAYYTVTQAAAAAIVGLAIVVLLIVVLVLAWIDLRLTAKLRRERRAGAASKPNDPDPSER